MDKPQALLVASPGLGHIIPVLELGNRLSSVLNVHVTVFAVTSASSTAEAETISLAAARGTCEILKLPSVDIEHLVEPNAKVVTRIAVTMRAMRSMVQTAVRSMKRKPTVLIVDFFGMELISVIDEAIGSTKIGKFVYVPSHAWLLAFFVYLPVLDKVVEGEYSEIKEPMKIPGCRPVGPDQILDTMLDRSDQQYLECVRIGMELSMYDGILVNTWEELQGTTLDALRGDGELGLVMKVPVYSIGPVIRSKGSIEKSSGLFEWLDKQPEKSVLYVCFGSGGALSFDQTLELAWGLEMSGQRFLWVLSPPSVTTGIGAYLGASSRENEEVANGLLEGFLDRTRGVGLVVMEMVPQVEILGHGSVGGFLSHCGWSSVLESLSNGVPIVAWPLHSEQSMNATLLTEEIGVAVRTSRLPAKGVIGREEVATLVRKVMVEEEEVGSKIRAKVEEVRLSSQGAWTQGGSSHRSLFEWAKRCRLVS